MEDVAADLVRSRVAAIVGTAVSAKADPTFRRVMN
jgi:hypothetical protein